MVDHSTIEAMLRILDGTKSNKQWYDQKGLIAGYQSVTIRGQTYKGQRDTQARLARIPYDFREKSVLDVGCSNGAILHSLAPVIRSGVGLELLSKCVNAANALKAVNRVSNIHFYTFDLDQDDLSLLPTFLLNEKVDVCLFLNLALWVKRWKEAFTACSALATTVLFEAHGKPEQQREQIEFVRTLFHNVALLSTNSDDDPTYSQRSLYLCERHVPTGQRAAHSDDAQFLTTYTAEAIRQAYERAFPDDTFREVKILVHAHESVVAEVDSTVILKFPRPRRGIVGLECEKTITDFLRNRISVRLPEITIRTVPVAVGRYAKLPGITFDRSVYDKLPENSREKLATEIASFQLATHRVLEPELDAIRYTARPSWALSPELIREQLRNDDHPCLQSFEEEVAWLEAREVSEADRVFGHFDLHGSNFLLDEQQHHLLSVIDFGNCKVGDIHQDLSSMNLSSPDLAARIIQHYESISGRGVNREVIAHYTRLFYFNLLAGLKRSGDNSKFDYWLARYEEWRQYQIELQALDRVRDAKEASSIPHNWRKWFASNQMKGSEEAGLRKILAKQNFDEVDIATEAECYRRHPYAEAGEEIAETLLKRNWLLRTFDAMSALDPRYSQEVERREIPPFDVFVRDYYSRQLPVVLTGGADHWPARKWTPEHFAATCGDAEIEVQRNRESDPLYERNAGRHKSRIRMAEFVKMVREANRSNDFYMTANNTKASRGGIEPLYRDIEEFGPGYTQLDESRSGTFLWFGPAGIVTPLHHDITNNFLLQIYGRKEVTLIPALQVPYVYNDTGVFSSASFPDFDEKRHPLLKKVNAMKVVISPGETLFIPIGWWHRVEGLDISISVSFTNVRAPNHFYSDFPRKK